MTRAYRAELLKLRRRSAVIAGLLPAALAILTTVLAFALAKTSASYDPGGPNFVTSVSRLAKPDGLTYGFALAMSLVGLVVLIVTIANTTSEYGLGTLRTMFVARPDRRSWLAGRLLALLTALVVSFFAALVAGVVTAYAMAAIRGFDMSAWLSAAAVGKAAANYGNAVLGAALFGLAGTALAVLIRSTVLALALAIVWTFPLEHIIQGSWSTATQVFPGLTFATVAIGGTPDASYTSVLPGALGYGVLALLVSTFVLTRRDVTA